MTTTLDQILKMTTAERFKGVNARNLHQALKVGRDFSTWIKSRLQGANFIEEQDFIIVQDLAVGSPKRGNQKGGNKKATFDYILSIDTAKHICLMEKNKIGREIRQYFINAEKALRKVAPNVYRNNLEATQKRLAGIDYQHAMTEALQRHLIRQGKQPQPQHFINEAKLIDGLTVGGRIQDWKQANRISGNARDYFTPPQLETLAELVKTNTALIGLDMPYTERKQHLTALAHRLRQQG